MIVETVGGLISGPVFAGTFILGVDMGVIGLPFLVLALISLSSAAFLLIIKTTVLEKQVES